MSWFNVSIGESSVSQLFTHSSNMTPHSLIYMKRELSRSIWNKNNKTYDISFTKLNGDKYHVSYANQDNKLEVHAFIGGTLSKVNPEKRDEIVALVTSFFDKKPVAPSTPFIADKGDAAQKQLMEDYRIRLATYQKAKMEYDSGSSKRHKLLDKVADLFKTPRFSVPSNSLALF